MPDLIDALRCACSELKPDLKLMQRVRRLMRANQVNNIPANGRRLELQPAGLLIIGTPEEGMVAVLDHYEALSADITTCRYCGCTDLQACMTASGGPCCWRVKYRDGTGLCSACDDLAVQTQLFPHAGAAG
jgi:hypothetical protein